MEDDISQHNPQRDPRVQLSVSQEAQVPPATAPSPISLRTLAMRGSVVTIVGFGSVQLLRLATNVILARWLAPEAFGLMLLCYGLLEGLAMFSAVGEGPAIIRDKRGDDPDFLNTAWTVQALRGLYIWLAACLLAWPMSRFYGNTQLAQLVPVVGLTCVMEGFNSTAIHTAKRHMSLGRLTMIDLIAHVIAASAMVTWAYFSPTVWALPVFGIVDTALMLLLSHRMLPNIGHRFRWDRNAVRTLREFGKWIFLSSALEFIARQSDKFLLGHYVEFATLGIYAVAVNLSEPVVRLNTQMTRNIMMPALSRTFRAAPELTRNTYYRARLGIDALHLPVIGFLASAGALVVSLMYRGPFTEAGWMLQILCLRTSLRCLTEPSSAVCMAMGTPRHVTLARLLRAISIVAAIPIGWHFGGIAGVIWGVGISEVPVLLALWGAQIKLGVFDLRRESVALLLSGAGWIAGWLLKMAVS